MRTILISTLALFVSFFTMAQTPAFKTLASKGSCIVQRGSNPDEYTPLKAGVSLFDNDKVIITGDNSYVGLVSNKGKTIELKKGGVYNVKELTTAVNSTESNLAEKYVQFLVNEMSKTDESVAKNMKYTGSVERSLASDEIALFLPKSTKIAKQEAIINWYPKSKHSGYIVNIHNMFDEKVYTTKTSETSIKIDFAAIGLEADEVYKLTVADAADPSKVSTVVSLQTPSNDLLKKVSSETKTIKEQTPKQTAIQNMVLATYFDQNGMFLNAIPYYQNAIALEPDVQEYRTAYNRFLYKIGLEMK